MLHAVWLLPVKGVLKFGLGCHQRMAKRVALHYSGAMDDLFKLHETVQFLLFWSWPCSPTVSLVLACLTPQGLSAAHQTGRKVTQQSLPAVYISSPRS